MDTTVLLDNFGLRAANFWLAALLCVWAVPSHGGQASGQFSVAINLQNGAAPTGVAPAGTSAAPAAVLCRSGSRIGAFGTTLIVDCATGAPVNVPANASGLPWTLTPDNSARYMLNVYPEGEQLGKVEGYMGAGTITSWRTIKLNNRDYIEMMLHW